MLKQEIFKMKKRVLAISGSTKMNSSSSSILQFISKTYAEKLQITVYDGLDKLPHFNPDLDNESPPAIIRNLRNQIQSADYILICTPEYVFSLPGSLKNLIEWNVSTTVFSKKPVAIIVAAASGEKALESLELIMTTLDSRITNETKLLIKGAKGKIGAGGEIKDSDTSAKIKAVVASLMNAS